MTSSRSSGPIALVGRILLAAVWLPSGLSKIGNFNGTVEFMAAAGMPAPALMLVAAILIEVIAPVLLLAGYKTRWAAGSLIAFMVLATYYFHLPWTVPPEQFMEQMIHFSKNNALTGALLLLWVQGPGPWSLEQRSAKVAPGNGFEPVKQPAR